MLLSFLAIIITKQLKSPVTWPFDSRWAISYGWSIVTICVSLAPLWRSGASNVGRTDERTDAQMIFTRESSYAFSAS